MVHVLALWERERSKKVIHFTDFSHHFSAHDCLLSFTISYLAHSSSHRNIFMEMKLNLTGLSLMVFLSSFFFFPPPAQNDWSSISLTEEGSLTYGLELLSLLPIDKVSKNNNKSFSVLLQCLPNFNAGHYCSNHPCLGTIPKAVLKRDHLSGKKCWGRWSRGGVVRGSGQ